MTKSRVAPYLSALPPEEFPVLLLDDVHLYEAGACDALREWIAAGAPEN